MPVSMDRDLNMTIQSHQGDYPVAFVTSKQDLTNAMIGEDDPFLIIDENVASLYPNVTAAFDSKRIFRVRATEDEKTLAGVERACRFLQRNEASKRSTLVIVGGGILQDIGAFAAHIYYRGIPFVYIPTTLLSMADSCIGAKSGVNLGEFKNQLGFFQSPKRVVMWTQFLRTLPGDDVRSGFGEILKLSITSGEEAYSLLEGRITGSGFKMDGMDEVIARSLRIKKAIIEDDEYESGLRKTLNYGHTFGHALEGVTEHEIPHGLAVAWGVAAANYVAFQSGMLPDDTFTRMHHFIAKYFALRVHHSYNAADILRLMRRDKKAAAGSVQLILPTGFGQLRIVPRAIDSSLENVLAEYISDFDIFLPAE